MASIQNSTVYLQWSSRERGELIFQTTHGCQVYRPWRVPGKDETGHLPPQTHWDPMAPLGLISVPRAAQETWKVLPGVEFLTGPRVRSPASLVWPGSLLSVAVLV